MPTLAGIDGRSLALDLERTLNQLEGVGDRRRAKRDENELIALAQQARGIGQGTFPTQQQPQVTPQRQEKAGGFLRKIAPDFADALAQLNQSRDPEAVDQMRAEALGGRETADRILAAKSQTEKQKIILERAENVRQQGGDTRELLKQAGGSAAEMDLQAQKAQLTSKAALDLLPAPTDAERLRARAALSVRDPNALVALQRDEKVARDDLARKQALARAAGAAGRKDADAAAQAALVDALSDEITGAGQPAAQPTDGTLTEAPTNIPDTVDPALNELLDESVGTTQADAVSNFNREAAQQDDSATLDTPVILPPEEQPAAETVDLTQTAESRAQGFAEDFRTANENVAKARTLLNSPDKNTRIAAKTLVSQFEAEAKSAKDSLQFEADALEAFPVVGEGGENAQVRATKFFANGVTLTSTDAGPVVTNPSGEVVTGAEAASTLNEANAFEVQQQRLINEARETGKLETQIELGGEAKAAVDQGAVRVKIAKTALDQSNKIQTNIRNIDSAIAAIDAGARTGAIEKLIPDITVASATLTNTLNKMGLDVVGATTFGALSAGELKLAQDVSAPRDLDETELRVWLVDRRNAQIKVGAMLDDAATFLTTKGNSLNGWIVKNAAEKAARNAGSDGQFQEGQTATNTAGEVMVFRGGSWQPQ